jgi:hypothetical protein
MRISVIVLVLVLTLPLDARGAEVASPPTPDPVSACQAAIARTSRQLGDGIRSQIGKCIATGVRCLTAAATDLEACCAAAAPRCHAQEQKLARAAQRFAATLAHGRCARIAFDTVLDPNGLGFERAAETCRCLPAQTDVADLRSLGTCVARLVDAETTKLLAVAEAPRAAEALACVGLDHELAALETTADPACDRPSPSVVVTPTTAPSPTLITATATTLASATPVGATAAPTRTPKPRRTPTGGATPTATASATSVATDTATPTVATTATRTSTPGRTPIATRTPIPTRTLVPTPTPTSTPVCGNGIVEGDEECDSGVYDTTGCLEDVCTCDDFCDDAGGSLACRKNCTIDFSHCTAGGCAF